MNNNKITVIKSLRLQVKVNFSDVSSLSTTSFNFLLHSNKLWELTDHKPIGEVILIRKWPWLGHTLRRFDNHVSKRSLKWQADGKENAAALKIRRRSAERGCNYRLQLDRLSGYCTRRGEIEVPSESP